MLHIAIADENLSDVQQLRALIHQILTDEPATISVYRSGKQFLEDPEAGETDLIFFSVHPETAEEIRFAREINERIPGAEIIYLFKNLHYCADIYDTRYAYVLLKPIDPERLKKAIKRAREDLETILMKGVLIPLRGGISRRFFASDILYCERRGRETALELGCGEAFTALRIGQLEELLPRDSFVRPHNSFLANLAHVKKVENRILMMDNGAQLPISNQKRDAFVDALRAYI